MRFSFNHIEKKTLRDFVSRLSADTFEIPIVKFYSYSATKRIIELDVYCLAVMSESVCLCLILIFLLIFYALNDILKVSMCCIQWFFFSLEDDLWFYGDITEHLDQYVSAILESVTTRLDFKNCSMTSATQYDFVNGFSWVWLSCVVLMSREPEKVRFLSYIFQLVRVPRYVLSYW